MRNRIFLALDVLLAVAIVFVSFTARFEGLGWWPELADMAITYAAISVGAKIIVFWRMGLYTRLWRYASIADLELAILACLLGVGVSFTVGLVIIPLIPSIAARVPIGVLGLDSALSGGAVTLTRLLLRVASRHRRVLRAGPRALARAFADREGRRVLIAGAGEAGAVIAKEMLDNHHLGLVPVGFVDDDRTKHGHHLHGLRVFGPICDLESIVKTMAVDEVIIALPAARGKIIRDIMQRSAASGVRNRTVPALSEILSGSKAVSALRPIQIEDLLRRDPIQTDTEQVATLITDKTILITGAGGSIGSELCRQVAQLAPSKIVAVGRGENSIFELVEELRVSFPNVPVSPAIVDVRDEIRLRPLFETHRPFTVFHAAAHKHVPLMETSVDEAILNNVLGTRNVAELSAEFGVTHLVLISTDKAVRPTSIMGATKRLAEGALCSVAERTGKSYVSVRFGNVLGSRGSVVPTFLRQIAGGGPVTITHPEMRRYFMTIPEAVQLVLQAAALGHGGEVFVLDMGEPVRIADLAEDLIRLSGLEVGGDIEISYTGLRPGEKMYEELFFGPANASPTIHPKILRARETGTSADSDAHIERLIEAARRRTPEPELRRMIQKLVPEYTPTVPSAILPITVRNPEAKPDIADGVRAGGVPSGLRAPA